MFYVNAKYRRRRIKIEEFLVQQNEQDVSEEKMPSVIEIAVLR
jgi:hypothetical protein